MNIFYTKKFVILFLVALVALRMIGGRSFLSHPVISTIQNHGSVQQPADTKKPQMATHHVLTQNTAVTATADEGSSTDMSAYMGSDDTFNDIKAAHDDVIHNKDQGEKARYGNSDAIITKFTNSGIGE